MNHGMTASASKCRCSTPRGWNRPTTLPRCLPANVPLPLKNAAPPLRNLAFSPQSLLNQPRSVNQNFSGAKHQLFVLEANSSGGKANSPGGKRNFFGVAANFSVLPFTPARLRSTPGGFPCPPAGGKPNLLKQNSDERRCRAKWQRIKQNPSTPKY